MGQLSHLVTRWAVPFPLMLIRRDWTLFLVGFRRWHKRARWARRKLNAAPSAMRTVVIAATVLAVFFATNLVYQVVRKPTEMFFPVSGATSKMPAETWRQYAPLFREYSTAIITPELLAAPAQIEGAGESDSKNLLAVAPDLEPLRDLPTRIERRRHVSDDRRSLRRGGDDIASANTLSCRTTAGSTGSTLASYLARISHTGWKD
jgi:predicted nucleic acid-binding protein